MAYVVKRPRGTWEIRESLATAAGPRARTLATFRKLTPEIVERAINRARTAVTEHDVLEAALRAGASVVSSPADEAGTRLLDQLAQGRRPSPALRRLLRDALSKEGTLPENARWIGASLDERGRALHDLLLMTDRLPARTRDRKRSPRLDSRPS